MHFAPAGSSLLAQRLACDGAARSLIPWGQIEWHRRPARNSALGCHLVDVLGLPERALPRLGLGERSFDVLTLLNVLEHLKHPRAALVSLAAISSPGGLLVVVVPDTRLHRMLASMRRFAGSNDPFWMDSAYQPIVAIDPPYHLTCFEPRTLRLLLESCGYKVRRIANAPVISNPELWKRASKITVASLGRCLEILSLGRIVLGYSTIAVAQKQ